MRAIAGKTVWLVWSQTDLTEGKGFRFVKHVCETEATANRLAYKKYVQGSNCPVEKSMAYRLNVGEEKGLMTSWYALSKIERPTKDDLARQKKINELEAAVAKAKAAGLTEEDIRALRTK